MSIDYVQVGNDVSINYIVRGGDYTSLMSTQSFYDNYHNNILTISGLRDIIQGSNEWNCIESKRQMRFFLPA